MESKNKTFEMCIGVGLNQLFPEYITIEIPNEEESEVEAPRKRGRKSKKSQEGESK